MTCSADIHVLHPTTAQSTRKIRRHRHLQIQLEQCLKRAAERYAAQMEKDVADIVVVAHGLASYKDKIALCLATETRNQVNYRTVNETTTRLVITDIHLDGQGHDQTSKLTFPWQLDVLIDEGKALGMILSRLSDKIILQQLHGRIDQRLMFNAVAVCVFDYSAQRPGRLAQASSLLKHLMSSFSQAEAFGPYMHFLRNGTTPATPITTSTLKLLRAAQIKIQKDLQSQEEMSALFDYCPISECGRPIYADSVDRSPCEAGHHLASRCGITFLPLLDPAAIKYCSRCSRSFMNEVTHPLAAGMEIPQNLPSYLLSTFAVCPYCGGKYYHKHRNTQHLGN